VPNPGCRAWSGLHDNSARKGIETTNRGTVDAAMNARLRTISVRKFRPEPPLRTKKSASLGEWRFSKSASLGEWRFSRRDNPVWHDPCLHHPVPTRKPRGIARGLRRHRRELALHGRRL
jgi:hypothetical protein